MNRGQLCFRWGIIFCLLLTVGQPSFGDTSSNRKVVYVEKKARSKPSCGFWLSLAAVSALSLTYLSPALYHDLKADINETQHIGYGIHMDWENIEAALDPEEKELLNNPEENGLEIAEMFLKRLAGEEQGDKYVQGYSHWFPGARSASSFFKGHHKERGSCRHRSVVLYTILNHYGVKASIRVGSMQNDYDHMWIHLDDYNMAAESLNGLMESADTYEVMFVEGSIKTPSDWQRFLAGTYY